MIPPLIRAMRRHKDIRTQHLWEDDLVDVIDNYPDVNYRYLIRPAQELLPEYELLEFANKYTDPLIGFGREDAEKAVKEGPGVAF